MLRRSFVECRMVAFGDPASFCNVIYGPTLGLEVSAEDLVLVAPILNSGEAGRTASAESERIHRTLDSVAKTGSPGPLLGLRQNTLRLHRQRVRRLLP